MTAASSVSTASTSGIYKFPLKSSKSSRVSTVTKSTTSRPRRRNDDEFSALLKVYRKVFEQKVRQQSQYDTMTTHNPSPTPVASHVAKPGMLVQPRSGEKGSYVQRYKVLRDRNKKIPKLDWNAKASGPAKQYSKLPETYSRSYTYESIHLPSLPKASVITQYSGGNKSVYSDNYRHDRHKDKEDTDRKVNLQVLIHFSRWKLNTNQQKEQGDSYKKIKGNKEFNDVLLKSLPNIAADNANAMLSVNGAATGETRLVYRTISKQKVLSDRSHLIKEKDKDNANQVNEQTVQTNQQGNEHDHMQTPREKNKQDVERINHDGEKTILPQITKKVSEAESSVVVKDNATNMDGKPVASEPVDTESLNHLPITT